MEFERSVKYKDTFTKILGNYFKSVMNNEFSWNLFFRILFALEPLNNVGDFETFLNFLKSSFTESPYITKQKLIIAAHIGEKSDIIHNSIIIQVAHSLVALDSIEIVYDYNISEVNSEVESIYKYISNTITSIDDWNNNSPDILNELDKSIKAII